MSTSSENTLFIVGHSFVKKLEQDIEAKRVIFDVTGSHGKCYMHGIGGMTVSQLWGEIDVIAERAPSTVILDIGTNCLSCVSKRPDCLAREIVEIARAIRRLPSVRVVMVMPIITRMAGSGRTPPDFDLKRHRCNDLVRDLLQREGGQDIFPWKHRGMHRDRFSLFNRRGIHLNADGTKRYANSLRQAAYFAARRQ